MGSGRRQVTSRLQYCSLQLFREEHEVVRRWGQMALPRLANCCLFGVVSDWNGGGRRGGDSMPVAASGVRDLLSWES